MINYHIGQQVLRQPFDIDVHRQTFTNYLEVIIDGEGQIMYAVPSHQQKLLEIAKSQLGMRNTEEVYDLCPQEYYFDVMGWLTSLTGCIAVYNEFHFGVPNEKQLESLRLLFSEGLYRGKL